jgi:hypothetical protein
MDILFEKLGTNKVTFEKALADYSIVKLLVRRHNKVVLPEAVKAKWDTLKGKGSNLIVLEYGLDMPVPIDDLRTTDEGVFATLSFDRSPFSTFVPWESVIAMAGDDLRKPVTPVRTRPKLKLV